MNRLLPPFPASPGLPMPKAPAVRGVFTARPGGVSAQAGFDGEANCWKFAISPPNSTKCAKNAPWIQLHGAFFLGETSLCRRFRITSPLPYLLKQCIHRQMNVHPAEAVLIGLHFIRSVPAPKTPIIQRLSNHHYSARHLLWEL